ncbi:CotH kinase family protein [Glycomyces xiaoerkulensis]|uniref:CotH kinase family protein n=1 Tax=Glycomyces xiaoerkulensis TaxID=2038139 RepID=UPI0018E47501|nr:CotH kinase family protein [Glycomyces xiaoerkulensis]
MRPITRTLAAVAATLTLAIGLAGSPAAAQHPEPVQTLPLWDSGTIHDVQVSIDDADFTELVEAYLESEDKIWITADVTIDGTTIPGAGIKLKGQSSLMGLSTDSSPSSLPWLIRLDKYTEQDYQGYKRIVVRSNETESALNEAVSLRMLEGADLVATKSFPTAFSVNGEPPVLRLIVQELDKTFDKENFGDPDSKDGGTLYKKKWDRGFDYYGDDPDDYDGAWEPKGGDESEWQPLLDYLDWMNNATDAEFAAELDDRMETEEFARYLAVQDLILNWDDIDGPGQNGFLRYTPSTGKMTVVAWDHNLAYGIYPPPPDPVDPPPQTDPDQRFTWGCPCVERALEIPQFRELYEQTFFRLKSELYDSGYAQTALDELAAPLYRSDLIDNATLDQEAAQVQEVFTQDITPRTGATEPPDGSDPPDDGTDPPPAGDDCTARIEVAGDWGSGWQGNVLITAGDSGLDGWRLDWTWPGGQGLSSHWNADVTASGSSVTATDVGWNGTVAAGQTVEAWGFIGSGSSASPEVTCTAD